MKPGFEDPSAYGSWLIETKLSPPVSNPELIDRSTALQVIDRISTHKVGLIVAPAGYGKTSLLSQWSVLQDEDTRSVAWVSLDASDVDVRQFASYCIAALTKAGVNLGQLELAAESFLVETALASVIPRIVASISNEPRQIILVLDDYHLAESPAVSEFVSTFLAYAPGNLRFLISSRTVPNLAASSLIASSQAFEVGVETLRFSREEMRSFAGDAFDEQTLNYLDSRAEGWAVAVQLAKLTPKEKQQHGVLPPTQREHIANYLIQQILSHCSPDERTFLLRSSILDRFSPKLAERICGSEISRNVLQNSTLVRPLLIRLDSEDQWYRYHHLFSELLSGVLDSTSPELIPSLHADASSWFEEHGDVVNAVTHAIKSGNVDRAVKLVLDAGGWELTLFGGVSVLRVLIRNSLTDGINRFPRLQIAYALLLMKDGHIKEAEAQLQQIEIDFRSNRLTELERRDYVVTKAQLDTYRDAVLSEASFGMLRGMLEDWPLEDPRGAGVIQALVGISANARWQFKLATEATNAGVSSMRRANSVLGISYCYMHLGQTAFYQGDFELAIAHLREAADSVEDNFGADSQLKNSSDIVLSALGYWQNHVSLDAPRLLMLLATACDTDSWFDVYFCGFSCLLDHGLTARDPELLQAALDLCRTTIRRKEISRLALLLPFFELYVAIANDNESDILRAARKCEELEGMEGGPFSLEANFIPLAESALMLNSRYGLDPVLASRLSGLNNIIGIAEDRGAHFFLIRLLVMRARIQHDRRGVERGVDDILKAAKYAARTSMKTPFATPAVAAIVRAAVRSGRDKPENRLEVAFLQDCLANPILDRRGSVKEDEKKLSRRELDVLAELAVGQSNKGIARALDMTDHTVKFHLKNIFAKLGVDNRISAINAARDMQLIH
ncbi:hypothetical protein BRX37_24770 [Sphingomonas sp. S-NIH.Pt3_0716]|nr:hypothetical protein BRX37_24770 [Sphingomonas sp. S-NIH.Pt3_0716]